nr:MAG TPA: hypothetical protein [Bacteriophage sp.]DAV71185.1 MAG TPA: hypothetical protein [Bacteriophage sp.]
MIGFYLFLQSKVITYFINCFPFLYLYCNKIYESKYI